MQNSSKLTAKLLLRSRPLDYFTSRSKISSAIGLIFAGSASVGLAQQVLPAGASVVSGSATISQTSPASLTINQSSARAIVNWNSFSVGQANSVNINQPSASSAMLNRVTGSTPSTIAGQINANGQVFLVNPNGIAITRSGVVNVGGGFVASTLDIQNNDFNAGKLNFTGTGASALVSNDGTITTGLGGFVGLIGGSVSNGGLVTATLGKVGLGSGERATLDLNGNGFLQVAVPTNSQTADGKSLIDVQGEIRANEGQITLTAATVRQAIRDAVNVSGALSARSVSGSTDNIVLGGGAGGNVQVSGLVDVSASKQVAQTTDGGSVAMSGATVTIDGGSAKIDAASATGKGGTISVTGESVAIGQATLDASGAIGGGVILLGGDLHGGGTLAHATTTTVGAAAILNASATQSGDGGKIVTWSDGATIAKGTFVATGGSRAGKGGIIETSGHTVDFNGITVNASAANGPSGTWLIDPVDLSVDAAAASTITSNLASANVTLQTTDTTASGPGTQSAGSGDINIDSALTWSSANTLALIAFNNINLNAPITAAVGGLSLDSGNQISAAAEINVGTFNLANGAWIQNMALLPTFAATDFRLDPVNADFLRVTAGSGSSTSPYQIADVYGLQGVAAKFGLNKDFALGSDIDASGTINWNAGAGFLPIGTDGAGNILNSNRGFNRNFDGKGHVISGLAINRPASDYVGLFGLLGATNVVQNVGMSGGNVIGQNDVGALVGGNEGTVQTSYATGNVTGVNNVGGLVGRNIAAGSVAAVQGSFASGEVNGTNNVGGLVGFNEAKVLNSYATGNVAGDQRVGGLVGYNSDTVQFSYATGLVSGTSFVGGLVGINEFDVLASYWDTTTSGIAISSGGTGLTTTQMQDFSTHTTTYDAAWDFQNVWAPPSTGFYPQLYALTPVVWATTDNVTRVYGDANPIFTTTDRGGVWKYVFGPADDSQNIASVLSTSAVSTSSIGDYAIAFTSTTATSSQGVNYRVIPAESGTLSVTARPITVTADAQSRTYGDANPLLTYTVGGSGLANSDTLSGSLVTAAALASNIGNYAITQGTLAASSNYAVAYTGADLLVSARPITVMADAKTRAYGDANPLLTYTVGGSGLANGDALTGALATTAALASNIGNYAITQGALAASSNYAVAYTGADLLVSARPITVMADAKTRAYGDANPLLTYTVGGSGLANGDALTGALATTAALASNIGNYAITQGALAASSNYSVAYTGADLWVTARPITVTANTQSRAYGDANPVLTFTVGGSGLANGDSMTGGLATTAALTSNVGNYGITQGTLAASSNYSVAYTGADLLVSARPITVTADAKSRTYGDANPLLTYTVGGSGLANSDTLSGSLVTAAALASNIGNYAITQGTLAASNNYSVAYTGANLLVTARPITVTADAQSSVYGDAKTLTYAVNGLVNGDVLSGALSTTAAASSNIGNYGIGQGSLSAGENYSVTYNANDLKVIVRPITVTANYQIKTYGDPGPSLTYDVAGLVNGDTLTGSLSTTVEVSSDIGNYEISQGSLSASGNYSVTYNAEDLQVAARPITVTADAKSRIFGEANPELTYSVGGSGLVNGDMLSGSLVTTVTALKSELPDVVYYDIIQGTLAAPKNYDVTYFGSKLFVHPIKRNEKTLIENGIVLSVIAVVATNGTLSVAADRMRSLGNLKDEGMTMIDWSTIAPNPFLQVEKSKTLPSISVTPGQGMFFSLPKDTFLAGYSGVKAFTANLANENPLPSWIRFDPATATLSGTPPDSFSGNLDVVISVKDRNGNKVSTSFSIIGPPPTEPNLPGIKPRS